MTSGEEKLRLGRLSKEFFNISNVNEEDKNNYEFF